MFLRFKLLSVLMIVTILAGLLAGCMSQPGNVTTLTLAVVEADFGEEANPDPQSVYAGVKLAAEQVNEAGGNIKVVVKPYQDGNDPIQATRIAGQVVEDGADAVIGHASIETSKAASDVYDTHKIPVINIIPVTEALIEKHPYQFNITYTAESEAAYLANYLTRIDGRFTVGIIHTDAQSDMNKQIEFRNRLAGLGGAVAFREELQLPVLDPALEDQEQARTALEAQLKEIVARMAALPVGERPNILFVVSQTNNEIPTQLKELMEKSDLSIPVKGLELLSGNDLEELIGRRQASIVATNDEYGIALSKQFRNTFKGLGGEIVVDRLIDKNAFDVTLDDAISDIISKGNNVPLFIAADEQTITSLFLEMKQQGVAAPIIGPSSFSSPTFVQSVKETNEEEVSAGYFTNGILTTRALVFDSANRYANQFLQDYRNRYNITPDQIVSEPSDMVVNGYDAVMALVTAAQRTDLPGETAANRDALYKALLLLDDASSSAQGIASPIFFEPSRNSSRAARFGIFQKGDVVSANVQFEPIFNPNEIKDLQDQVRRGRILTVNGRYVYKANVVYSGVDLLGIDEIDIKTSTYKMDFYLWFRYRPNERDADFQPDEFVFTNAEGDVEVVPVREETNADGTLLKTYRVNGTFKNQFRFQAYPFEHQDLLVEFRNQNATTSFIQYVVDRIGMRYTDEQTLLTNYKDNGAFASLYGWQEHSVQVAQDIFPTFSTFGNPLNFGRSVATNYSLIKVNVDIQRDSLQYIVKSLLPLLITLILAYITFFLPLGHSERLAVGSTALLTTAFFHLQLADSLPEIGYTVAMEYLFYASYIMSALMVLLETLSIRYEKLGEDTKKRLEKKQYLERRERLNTLGRIIYPSILGVVFVAGMLVYFGWFRLEPRTVEAERLAELAVGSEKAAGGEAVSGSELEAAGGQVKLTLNTWRPEDSEQIESLLKGFQDYARAQGLNIVIEHKPVVSVNYDAIMDLQLARGSGPDLFYVRPFSVDGSISKYLLPLNPAEVDVASNYEETKTIPWTNRNQQFMAVPYVGVVQGVYYNQKLFADYGLTPPNTWDEFLSQLETLRRDHPNVIPIANALNASEDSEMFMSIAANFLGGPDGRARLMQLDGNSVCYNSATVVRAFRALEDLKPYLPGDAAEIDSKKAKELFFDGKAVMLFGGSWDLQTVIENANFSWDVFAVPGPAKQPYVIFQPDVGVGINRASPHQEEAKLFLNWLMSQEAVGLTAESLAGFYPLNKLGTNKAVDENSEKFLNLVKGPTDIRWMFTEISSEYPRADVIIRNNLYNMVKFDLTPLEAAENLQSGLGEWYEPAQSCNR